MKLSNCDFFHNNRAIATALLALVLSPSSKWRKKHQTQKKMNRHSLIRYSGSYLDFVGRIVDGNLTLERESAGKKGKKGEESQTTHGFLQSHR